MKKILFAVMLAIMLMPVLAFAEGTVTQSEAKITDHNFKLTFSFIANAAGTATIPATATTDAITGWVCQIETSPGSPAPTSGYDITITKPNGLDIAGGQLADRATATAESIIPKVDAVGIYSCLFVDAVVLTLNVTGNSVNSATGEVKLLIWTDKESPL